jgi:serine/threonine protein kinase
MQGLRRCEDLEFDTPGTEYEDCFLVLSKYECFKVLGHGEFGVALQVMHSESTKPLVIKILLDKDEVESTCMVEKRIAQYDSTFSRMYGWTSCHGSKMPSQWKEMLRTKAKEHAAILLNEVCYFMVMEFGNGVSVSNYVFESIDQFRTFMYELILSLKRAYERAGFIHEDMHAGNVLFLPGPFHARVYDDIIIDAPYRPMIIDYGASTFDDVTNTAPLADVNTFMFSLIHRRTQDPLVLDWMRKFYSSVFTPSSNSFQVALDYLIIDKAPIGKEFIPCSVCAKPATQTYKKNTSWRFCDKLECVKSMGLVGHII